MLWARNVMTTSRARATTRKADESPGLRIRAPFVAYGSLFLLGLLATASWQTLGDYAIQWNQRELVRVTSPDRQLDAVFVRRILPFPGPSNALYLIPRGDPLPALGGVFRGSRFHLPPALIWKNQQLLEVRYQTGCVDGFSNLWHSSDFQSGNYYVEVRLEPGSTFTCVASPPGH